jgi:N-acetylmuramoyl-L-alanine amidase
MMTLALDPGHGMSNRVSGVYDTGAVGVNGAKEAEVALAFALAVKWVSENDDRFKGKVKVVLTRDATSPAPVGSRAGIARRMNADAFISIHLNAFNGSASGTEVLHRPSVSTWPELVHEATVKALGLPDRGLKTEGQSQHKTLAVLNFGINACLVELGFIDNQSDMARLSTREARLAFAEAVLALCVKWSEAK